MSSWSRLSFCTASVQAGVQGPCRRAKTPWPWRTDWARGPYPRMPNVTFWTDWKLAPNLDFSCVSALPTATLLVSSWSRLSFYTASVQAFLRFSTANCHPARVLLELAFVLHKLFAPSGILLLVRPPLTRSPCWRQGSADNLLTKWGAPPSTGMNRLSGRSALPGPEPSAERHSVQSPAVVFWGNQRWTASGICDAGECTLAKSTWPWKLT